MPRVWPAHHPHRLTLSHLRQPAKPCTRRPAWQQAAAWLHGRARPHPCRPAGQARARLTVSTLR